MNAHSEAAEMVARLRDSIVAKYAGADIPLEAILDYKLACVVGLIEAAQHEKAVHDMRAGENDGCHCRTCTAYRTFVRAIEQAAGAPK